jgi:hypothetical protein
MSDSLSGVLRFSLNHLIMVSAVASIQQRQANRPDLDPVVLPRTRSFMAFGIFLFFGAVMAILASTTLLWQGTVLDRVWPLNPTAYKQLTALGGIVGIFFLVLDVALAKAGIGWSRLCLWGRRLAVGIISMQVLGDVVNCVRGDWLRGGSGTMIARALLLLLLRPRSRAIFAKNLLRKCLQPDRCPRLRTIHFALRPLLPAALVTRSNFCEFFRIATYSTPTGDLTH